MKQVFILAFGNKRHRTLIFLTMLAMCLSTLGTQMEAMSLAIVTQKGIAADARGGVIQQIIDQINQIIPIRDSVAALALLLVVVAVFKAVTLFVYRYSTRLVAIRVSRDLRQAYFEHIQSLPMSFYQEYNSGSLSSRVVGDAFVIAEAINACLVNYVQTPFTVVTTLGLCFLTSWRLSLIVFIGMPLIMGTIAFISKHVKRVAKQIQKNQEHFTAVLLDFIAGIQTIKLFGMEQFSLDKYKEQNDRMALLEQKSARYDLSSRPIVHVIGISFLATSLVVGLYIFEMTVPEVLFFGALLYTFYEPIKKFAEENSRIHRGAAAAERMHEVLALNPRISDFPGAEELASFEGSIEFKDVWFRYDQQWILQGVSFSVEKGQTVAIVGPTGAGKSTVVQLLPRLYDVERGEILINGKSITTYTQRSLREQIGFVPQRPFLFVDTIARNISFGRPYDQERISAAAEQAHADDFICRLPEGYETVLAETGSNLSGGQQQRLAIARALVKQAPILIMDEATSSLDTISEQRIKSAIRELRGKMTQIIIAHRLTTIEDADKIIYLEEGKKVAEGSKEELLASCSGFRNMWQAMVQRDRSHG